MKSKLEFLLFSTLPSTNYVSFHKHSCYEFVYYVSGSGSTTIDGTKHFYSKNTFSITIPEIYHDEKHFEDTEIIFIGVQYYGNGTTLENGIFHDDGNNTILKLFEQMKEEMLLKRVYYQSKLDLLSNELLIEIERLNNNATVSDSGLSNIERFIKQNSNQNIDLKNLAEISGYSYHHFRHIFKKQTGLSPINYIINQRLENAKELLINTDHKMSCIAQECGFSTNSQFNLLFKKLTKLTPSEFKKINSSKEDLEIKAK